MNYGPSFDGFGGFPHLIGLAFYGIFVLIVFAALLTLAFLLARFLLVATRAAKIYVEKNGSAVTAHATAPAASSAPVTTPVVAEPTATTTTAARAATKPVTPVTPAPKPATKPRTPKTPPTP